MAVMGEWGIFTRNGGKPGKERGVGFIMGDCKTFKVSLHGWRRPPPPHIAYPLHFFKFCSPNPPLPCDLQTAPTHYSFCCTVSLPEWVITPNPERVITLNLMYGLT